MSEFNNQCPVCAACGSPFNWDDAYQSQNTPGSTPHNPPGHGVFRPRAYCPNCGALVAEWHIDRYKDYNVWAWYGENAALNSSKDLPPNPLMMWGRRIPVAFLPTIDEHQLAIEKIEAGAQTPKEPGSTAEAKRLAGQAGQHLNQGELEKAADLFEQASAAGLNRGDYALALGALGVYYLSQRGEVENAYRYCRRGVDLDPSANWQANYVLSLIYSAAGETEKAGKELAEAQRFAGTVWWDELFERGLKTNLSAWTEEHGKAALRALIQGGGAAATGQIPEGSKKCPNCGNVIKLEAVLCRFCRAKFTIIEKGYCSGCHKLVKPAPDSKCPTCHGELLDLRKTSKIVEEASPACEPAFQEKYVTAATAATSEEAPPARGISFWRLFFSPNGRINRSTFLLKGLLPLLGFLVVLILILGMASDWKNPESGQLFPDALMPVFAIGILVTAWGMLMLLVKRLHDLNRSGWNLLYIFIPIIGQLVYLIFWIMCIFVKGVDQGNRFDGKPISDASIALQRPSSYSYESNLAQARKRKNGLLAVGIILTLVAVYILMRPDVTWNLRRQPMQTVPNPTAAQQEFTSAVFNDHGVSFEYPSNWEIIDEDGVQTLLQGSLEGIGDWEYIGGVYTINSDDCLNCAQVTITIIPIPAEFPGWSDEFYEQIKQNAESSMGSRLQVHRQVQMGDYPGWETIYLGKSEGTKIWDKSYLPSGESILVTVSASSNPDQFDQFLPIFEQTFTSLSVYGASE